MGQEGLYGSVYFKREDKGGDIDLWPPAAFQLHLSCCPCAQQHHSPLGSFLSPVCRCSRATHLHVWVTSCVLCSGTLQHLPLCFTVTAPTPMNGSRHGANGVQRWMDKHLLPYTLKTAFNSQDHFNLFLLKEAHSSGSLR